MEMVFYPDQRLRQVCERVDIFDERLQQVAVKMIDMMHRRRGIGLAAPQVGLLVRLIVVCPSGVAGEEYVLVNPEVAPFTRTDVYEEGCLSLPGVFAEVERSSSIFCRAQNIFGKRIEFEADGLLARVIQHETDHLNGILFIDRITPEQMKKIEKQLRQLESKYGSGQT
ncbi:MAG: peptide deformylase [Planctomycetota bacterium]|nr:MAG: peptide deformylase [Planctomycetota bacterium]